MSVLKALERITKINKESHLILDIKEKIKKLQQKNKKITLYWILAHCVVLMEMKKQTH